MLTFEKVVEIFEDYLEQDQSVEVLKCRQGYVCLEWGGFYPWCENGILSKTPEELFEQLLSQYQSFAEIQLTKGRRELTEEDERQVANSSQKYWERRRPVVAVLALFVWTCSGLLYVSAFVFGLAGSIIGLLGIAVLITYSVRNGITLLVIAFLVSPVGIPMAAVWLLGKVQAVRYAIQDWVY